MWKNQYKHKIKSRNQDASFDAIWSFIFLFVSPNRLFYIFLISYYNKTNTQQIKEIKRGSDQNLKHRKKKETTKVNQRQRAKQEERTMKNRAQIVSSSDKSWQKQTSKAVETDHRQEFFARRIRIMNNGSLQDETNKEKI